MRRPVAKGYDRRCDGAIRRVGRRGLVGPRCALALAGAFLTGAMVLASVAPAAAADTIGNCELTGQKGAYKLQTAVPGQLTVEVSLPAPGWWNGDTPETIKDGYEYCMAADIAHRAGLDKLVVVNTSWAKLIGGQTTNFDLALSEASITDERKKVVDFSIPYFDSDIGVLVKKGTKVDAESVKSMRVGVHQATTGADFVEKVLKPAQAMKVYPNVPAMFAALSAGQIDAALTDTAYVLGEAAQSNGALVVAGQYSTGEKYGAVYPKGSPNEATLDKIIQSMNDDGTLNALAKKYLAAVWGADPTTIPYLKP
ncbi:MAG: amino acid ABC transporter substrate-binding protein [Hyphomicrobiales bacterium]|nr:amino acid ABC transporter substrate-binding protein [Hyphomicrobiales bacterium]